MAPTGEWFAQHYNSFPYPINQGFEVALEVPVQVPWQEEEGIPL